MHRARKTLLRGSAIAALLAVLLPPAAAAERRMPRFPDVLLVTIDTWRWDYLGAAGTGRVETPNLDAVARRGALLTNTRVVAPVTLVSHTSILTGTRPPTHGVRSNGRFSASAGSLTLAEMLRAAGYRTGAVVGAFVLNSRFGLRRGFDLYEDVQPPGLYTETPARSEYPEISATAVTERALRVLEGFTDDRPWFLWVHYFDPHADYHAPAAFAARYPTDPYAAEVAYVDAEVGRLLAGARRRAGGSPLALAVTADHGESLGAHGESTHGLLLSEETLRVSTLLDLPGLPAGFVSDRPVSSTDLVPTLLQAVGLPVPDVVEGRSLSPLWRGGTAAEESPCAETLLPYFEDGWAPLRAILDDGWKYVLGPAPELYDLRADPREETNLVAARPERAAELRAAVLACEPLDLPRTGTVGRIRPAREEVAALESLGYGGSTGAPAGGDPLALPDPRSRLHVHGLISRAWIEHGQGRLPEALALLRSALGEDPGNPRLLEILATFSREAGRPDDAATYLAELAAVRPSEAWRAVAARADLARARGNPQRAEAAYLELLRGCERPGRDDLERCLTLVSRRTRDALDRRDPAGARRILDRYPLVDDPALPLFDRLKLLDLLARAGSAGAAEERLARLAAGHPEVPDIPFLLGNLYQRRGDAAGAAASFRRALDVDPGFRQAKNNLATLDGLLGRLEEANRLLREILAEDPDDDRALNNLALNLYRQGDRGEAIELFRRAIERAPAAITPRLNLARVYQQAGDEASARTLYGQVLRLDPSNPTARAATGRTR